MMNQMWYSAAASQKSINQTIQFTRIIKTHYHEARLNPSIKPAFVAVRSEKRENLNDEFTARERPLIKQRTVQWDSIPQPVTKLLKARAARCLKITATVKLSQRDLRMTRFNQKRRKKKRRLLSWSVRRSSFLRPNIIDQPRQTQHPETLK